jgi:hypothetical protein
MTVGSRAIFVFLLVSGLMAIELPPRVPENLEAPKGEAILLMAIGRGKQIYACEANEARFEWVLLQPQAELFDRQGKKIGMHYQGPTWEATDGSKVTGEVQQRAAAPHKTAVPWLLLKSKSNEGQGTFGKVAHIQRVDTVGGAAPHGGCNKSGVGREIAVDYQANYYFYGAAH